MAGTGSAGGGNISGQDAESDQESYVWKKRLNLNYINTLQLNNNQNFVKNKCEYIFAVDFKTLK